MKIDIQYKIPKKILTPTSGFLYGYSHSLNPYAGCAFGCSYCYVRQSPIGLFRKQAWGTWVDVKQEARELLIKEIRQLRMRNKEITIFMSSSTDPYQPVEYKEKVTRTLLEALVESPPDFLFVQTRSPLVTRDIDLFLHLKDRIRISVTVETDLEEVRKRFSPQAPPIQARLKALKEMKEADLPTQAAVAPVLPFSKEFPAILSNVTDRVVIDDYSGDGSQGKRTDRLGISQLYDKEQLEQWYHNRPRQFTAEEMKTAFRSGQIFVGQQGFMPF
ncbi:MAG TPA: radical SAM protein [Bacillus sp. (in: firmicutes)]|uniref:SPL family radical SAM protein n=1 Tax=Bacillus litorisediminis TaxID=2922713 RepID=UPI001FACE85A|nr:radical SAM protein [Bacillus litorisediminis]HWO75335.1 radical SAM protein [Bacillus sp. (in: firmicutes)]